MNYSYKLNQNTNFPGQSSEKKKKPVYDSYPYRAQLNYDSAPSLLGRIPSSDDSPSLFAPQSEGERIRRQLKSAVDKALGKPSYSGIFDNIDTKKIEENIPVAESIIRKNKENNAYSMEDTKNLPYLRDGLAAFYALSEAGNHKAANVARKIAYTPYANAEKKQETQSRYVGEDNLLLHSAPGERAPDVASLSRGDEVYFTGNKTNETDGNSWAEVKYGDKTGWVRSNSLKTDKSQAFAGKRYVGEETISMRAVPGMRGRIKETIDYGKEVQFTGNKETLDGIDWAEVEYGGKTGWVIANSLKTKMSDFVIDKNAPKDIIVTQTMNPEDRTEYLNKMIPEWMADTQYFSNVDEKMINWFKTKGATVRYTGQYCLPLKNFVYISQGFYGRTSHAGKYGYESGSLGAIDIAACKGEPVYSVLGGKVVYTPSPGFDDFHRVTVETKINGETYYLEYLHLEDINVKTGQILKMGTNVGTVGGWLRNGPSDKNIHLDFRVYKFKNENNKDFSSDKAKQFFDPLEFFDFDEQYEYNLGRDDYH